MGVAVVERLNSQIVFCEIRKNGFYRGVAVVERLNSQIVFCEIRKKWLL